MEARAEETAAVARVVFARAEARAAEAWVAEARVAVPRAELRTVMVRVSGGEGKQRPWAVWSR